MTTSLAAPRFSPELRAAIYHFAVFGSTGVASVYFAIWLSNRGISPDEIGIINAVPVLGLLLVNLVVGRLADRAKDWRQMIIALSLLAATIPIGLLFVSGFWGILLVWSLSVIPAFSHCAAGRCGDHAADAAARVAISALCAPGARWGS